MDLIPGTVNTIPTDRDADYAQAYVWEVPGDDTPLTVDELHKTHRVLLRQLATNVVTAYHSGDTLDDATYSATYGLITYLDKQIGLRKYPYAHQLAQDDRASTDSPFPIAKIEQALFKTGADLETYRVGVVSHDEAMTYVVAQLNDRKGLAEAFTFHILPDGELKLSSREWFERN